MTQSQFDELKALLVKVQDDSSEIREVQMVDIDSKIDTVLRKIESMKDEIIKDLRKDIQELGR